MVGGDGEGLASELFTSGRFLVTANIIILWKFCMEGLKEKRKRKTQMARSEEIAVLVVVQVVEEGGDSGGWSGREGCCGEKQIAVVAYVNC